MGYSIKHRWSGEVIYQSDKATKREAVLAAIKAGINLSRCDLSGSNLSGCDLSGSDLSWCNLSGSNLSGCDLSGSNLSGCDLSWCNLSWCDLSGCDLSGCNLSGSNLSGCDLSRCKGGERAVAMTVVAAQGDLRVWKKIREGVIELRVPAEAKRSNASGRKCRAEFAVVVSLPDGVEVGHSLYDPHFEYRVGETVRPTNGWDEDRWQECATGIHFYITREEAEAHT